MSRVFLRPVTDRIVAALGERLSAGWTATSTGRRRRLRAGASSRFREADNPRTIDMAFAVSAFPADVTGVHSPDRGGQLAGVQQPNQFVDELQRAFQGVRSP